MIVEENLGDFAHFGCVGMLRRYSFGIFDTRCNRTVIIDFILKIRSTFEANLEVRFRTYIGCGLDFNFDH